MNKLRNLLLSLLLLSGAAWSALPQSVYEQPFNVLITGEYSEAELYELMDEALSATEMGNALKQYAPQDYATVLKQMQDGYNSDQSIREMAAEMILVMEAILFTYLPKADDEALLVFVERISSLFKEFSSSTARCQAMLSGDNVAIAKLAYELDMTLLQEMQDIYVGALSTYDAQRSIPSEDEVMPSLLQTMMPVIADYGSDVVLQWDNPTTVTNSQLCLAMRDFYEAIGELPDAEATQLLRYLLSAE